MRKSTHLPSVTPEVCSDPPNLLQNTPPRRHKQPAQFQMGLGEHQGLEHIPYTLLKLFPPDSGSASRTEQFLTWLTARKILRKCAFPIASVNSSATGPQEPASGVGRDALPRLRWLQSTQHRGHLAEREHGQPPVFFPQVTPAFLQKISPTPSLSPLSLERAHISV